jgi:O-methyltransferase
MGARPHSLVPRSLIDALIREARGCPAGAFAELGVYKGGVAWHLAGVAREQGRALWLFDTFSGIPFADPIDVHKPGDFGDTSREAVALAIPDAVIVAGVFPESAAALDLPGFAFVHVDADQYRSVRAACERFAPLMVPGGVMWFDDYGCLDGATRAVDEAFAGHIRRTLLGRALVRF